MPITLVIVAGDIYIEGSRNVWDDLQPCPAQHAGRVGHRGGEPTEAQLVGVSQNLWSTFGDLAKKEAPQISGLRGFFAPIKRGAEGQRRTDTGSPLSVYSTGVPLASIRHASPH